MEDFKLAAPCLLGVEGLVAQELREMDAQNVEAQNGRVIFDGTPQMLRAQISAPALRNAYRS